MYGYSFELDCLTVVIQLCIHFVFCVFMYKPLSCICENIQDLLDAMLKRGRKMYIWPWRDYAV